jgi:hypothetical protein
MNRFNIPNPSGGHRLKAHDLNLIYDYLAEAINGLATKQDAILSGCRILGTFPNETLEAGFVCLGGEVYRVNQTVFDPNVITDPVLVPHESVVSPSPRTSADSSTKNVHFSRVAVLEQNASQANSRRLNSFPNYNDELRLVLNPAQSGTVFQPIYDNAGGWRRVDSAYANYANLRVRKRDNYVELVGCCVKASFAATKILQMPFLVASADYAPLIPSSNQVFLVSLSLIGSGPPDFLIPTHWANIVLTTAGELVVANSSYTGDAPAVLHFNHKIPLF